MAIFSKKQSARKPEDQAKVIVDGALEAKPAEKSPDKESALAGAKVPEPAANSRAAVAPTPVEPAAATPAEPESAHEEIEPEAIVTPPVAPPEHRFGIDDAIQLMRSLPTESNTALVVRVVRATLGAVHVSVEEIVADATRKEARVKESIATLEIQIVELDKQLGSLRREIAAQQADLKETMNVRERLLMADHYPGPKPPPPPPTAVPPRNSGTKPIVP
jgi:hypothetical protein